MKFSPSIECSILEPRVVLSGNKIAAQIATLGAPTDPNIPFVIAPEGVSQSSINFTTHRASQVLHGNYTAFGYRPGIYKAFSIFAKRGNIDRLNADLDRLSTYIPYGRVNLLPIWQEAIVDITPETTSDSQLIVTQSYTTYLKANIGTTFNYLQSPQKPNEFNIPTNGTVGKTK